MALATLWYWYGHSLEQQCHLANKLEDILVNDTT